MKRMRMRMRTIPGISMSLSLNTTANRYILRELIPPFLLNGIFFTFIFLLTQILDITNMVVNYRIGMGVVLRMLLYSVPYFLVFILPMSVMMSVLLTFLRMSGDNEVLALKSGGVSLYQMLPPVIIFAVFGTLITGFMILYGLPWGRTSLKDLTVEVAASNLDIGLKERTFNDSFEGVMLYVSRIDVPTRELVDVFIRDERSIGVAVTIVAPRGKLFQRPGKAAFQLRLYDGIINQADIDKRTVNTVDFDTYDLNLDLQQAMTSARTGPKDEKEMFFNELLHFLQTEKKRDARYYQALLEFHKKFSIPFACLALGLLAVPLGVGSKFSRKSFGLGLGLTFFLLYYLLLSAGLVFGESGLYPPFIGMWVPNIVMTLLGLYLLNRAAKDRPVKLGLPYIMYRIKTGIAGRRSGLE